MGYAPGRAIAQDLAAIPAEVKSLKSYPKELRKVKNAFAIRITNEIEELFAKVEARV